MTLSKSPVLQASNVARVFAGGAGVKSANLALYPGQITALLGPSGSGKSTLLRAIAGLEPIERGEVRAGDVIQSRPGFSLPAEKRRVGVVFQDFALFPHLTVLGNVMFGLADKTKATRVDVAMELLARVGLDSRANSKPHELSGGEQQRVALARALAPSPIAMLLDEPFSGLDPNLRAEIREITFQTLRNAEIPTLLVTHEAEEALMYADSIAIMEKGVLVQEAPPAELYAYPATLAAMKALGVPNVVDAEAVAGVVETPFGRFTLDEARSGGGMLAIRPEALRLRADPASLVKIVRIVKNGPLETAYLANSAFDGVIWQAIVAFEHDLKVGQAVAATATKTHFFVG
jgi:iron(III) transport system ATP-binding protein